jgi:hypothetical protein
MRGANILTDRSNANGSQYHPVYPKTTVAKTIRHVVTRESVLVWAALSMLALGLVVAAKHSDAVHRQVVSIKARLHTGDVERHQIEREVQGLTGGDH